MAVTSEGIGQIIQAFADATLDPNQWMPALSMMSNAVGSASSALELADLSAGQASINCTCPLDGDVIDLYEERIYHINPRVVRARALPVGAIVDDRSLLIDGDADMKEFMDWLERTPNRYVLGGKLFDGGGHEIYFGSYFSEKQGPPTSWHTDIHRFIMPHLVNFIAASRAMSGNKLNNEIVTMGHLGGTCAFMLIDRSGRCIEYSTGFETALRSTGLLSICNKRLIATHAHDRAKVNNFLASALNGGFALKPPSPIRLTTPDSPAGLILRALPVRPGNDIFDVLRPFAVITLTDLDRPRIARCEDLIQLFDLTPREADVATFVGSGSPPAHVSRVMGISEYTVRQHLKSIFSKMGISRQQELIVVLSRLY